MKQTQRGPVKGHVLYEAAVKTPGIAPSSKLTEHFEHHRDSLQDMAHASVLAFRPVLLLLQDEKSWRTMAHAPVCPPKCLEWGYHRRTHHQMFAQSVEEKLEGQEKERAVEKKILIST